MTHSVGNLISKRDHVANIFQEYTKPSRLLQSFSNLSNTVVQTALSGQTKFVFEILQNADDAYVDPNREIEVTFILQEDYFIVHHNGKGFDYNDVERLCDYASQIEEVKATDLSKTGYKGLGFKSLFNLSDTIYIHSNGYSFRFDKTYWQNWQKIPWQIIPIWCQYEELPLYRYFPHNQPVNIILKVNNVDELEKQMRELIIQPDLLLFLHRINKLCLNLKGEFHNLERKSVNMGVFKKVQFTDNHQLKSSWLTITYSCPVPMIVKNVIQGTSQFIFPDKIKKATAVPITVSVQCDGSIRKIINVKGLLYCTLPTQLSLTLPYHVNSFFILNLDRSQLHENKWNEFLINQIGSLQLCLLREIAGYEFIRNYVINVFCRKIDHPFHVFCQAYSQGYLKNKNIIGWLPSYNGGLLRLCEAWINEIEFFKQNFENITISPYIISYDLKNTQCLSYQEDQVSRFNYQTLFSSFINLYYPQLTKDSYLNFINYLYHRLQNVPLLNSVLVDLKNVPLLRTKNGNLVTIGQALFEDKENIIPAFLQLNPVDNNYLPLSKSVQNWFISLGARLLIPSQAIKESILKWIENGILHIKMSLSNHIEIMNYLAKNIYCLTMRDIDVLKSGLIVLTLNNEFKLAKTCYFPDAAKDFRGIYELKEFANIISKKEVISTVYDFNILQDFFIRMGVCNKLKAVDIVRKSILLWINEGTIRSKITVSNYNVIIEFISNQYSMLEREIGYNEISKLKNILVLTLDQTFQKANTCFFESVIPKLEILHEKFPKNKLISKNQSSNVICFLRKIGVSDSIKATEIFKETILKCIMEGDINNQITKENHLHIIGYLADHWSDLNYYLTAGEKEYFKQIPILTNNDSFRNLRDCSLFFSDLSGGNIPDLDLVVTKNEMVSSDYDSATIKTFLTGIGVRYIDFINIYEKYCDQFEKKDNADWFLSELNTYWNKNKCHTNDILLNNVQKIFTSSPILSTKCGQKYKSVDIYNSKFNYFNEIIPNIIPLLDYDSLAIGLEKRLGFKEKLELKCIEQLINSFKSKERFGLKDLKVFFTKLLEQLKLHDENEVKKYDFNLFSEDYELKPAKNLYYFEEANATCKLKSYYLNRICGMSHEDTLQLSKLCGVNLLPFQMDIIRVGEMIDNSLKEFYLERLPYITIIDARKENYKTCITLRSLYKAVTAIKLFKCQKIEIQYPFGPPVKIQDYFEDMTLYVFGKWTSQRTKIHRYLKDKIGIISNVDYIMDMDLSEDVNAWLDIRRENRQELELVEKELKKLICEDFFEDYEPDLPFLTVKLQEKFKSSFSGSKKSNSLSASSLKINTLQYKITKRGNCSHPPLKWLGELCVFNFFQDHYKDKYPESRFQLFNDLFLLQHQSLKIKISWLNEKEDKNLPYGLVLEKDDDIKWLIKVQAIKTLVGNSFKVNHDDFIENFASNKEDEVEPVRILKYCHYNIFFPNVEINDDFDGLSYVLNKKVLNIITLEK